MPKHITGRLQKNFLPRIKQELMMAMTAKGLQGAAVGYWEDGLNSITSPANLENRFLEENELGKTFKIVPTKYTSPVPVDERATDLLKILPEFGKMALNFKYKSQVQDSYELANRILDVISKSKKRKEFTDDEMANAKKTLEWFGDSQLFQKTKLDEGTSKFKFFKGNSFDITNIEKAPEIHQRFEELRKDNDNESAIRKLKDEFKEAIEIIPAKEKFKRLEKARDVIEDKFYNGEITEAEYNIQIKPLEAEANAMGRNLVWSKVADKAMRYNQAMAFWFNPFSAFNNYMFGVVSNIIWAAGKTDYTPAQTIQAFGLMW
jgi:hypothetical protein